MESHFILGVYTFPYKTFNELNPTYAFQIKKTRFRTLKGGGYPSWGFLFVDLGQSHNPIGALLILSGVFCLWDDG